MATWKEFWNLRNLKPPTISSFEDTTCSVDVNKLSQYLITAIEDHSSLYKLLQTETTLMSRCIAQMNVRFHKDKGLKELEKINRAVKQYCDVDILQLIKSFMEYLPICKEKETNLPTRNLLDYLLVQMLVVTKLCIRIAEVSKDCAVYMGNQFSIGNFWKETIIALAISSKMWCLMKKLTKVYCILYENLLSARNNFQNNSENWLPQNFELPPNIQIWSGYEIFNEKFRKISKEKLENLTFINDDSDNELDEGLEISKRKLVNLYEQSEDMVEMLVDETKPPKDTMKKTMNNQSATKLINDMKDFKSILTLVKEESNTRRRNKEKCIFKNVDDLKWEKIKSFVNEYKKKGTADGVKKIKKFLRSALKE